MKKLALWVLLVAAVSLAGCEVREKSSITFKGPDGEKASVTVTGS